MSLDQGGRMEREEQRNHDLDQRVANLLRRLAGDLEGRLDEGLENSAEEIRRALDEHLLQNVEELRESVATRLRSGMDSLRENLARASATVSDSLRDSDEVAAFTGDEDSDDPASVDRAVTGAFSGISSKEVLEAARAIDQAPSEPLKRQQQILDALIQQSEKFSSRAAIFLARGEGFKGWSSRGFSDAGAKFRNHSLATDSDPALSEVQKGEACVGLAEEDCQRFCELLDVDPAAAGVLIPLVLRDKVAGVLYADRAASERLDVASLQLLVHLSALAIESLPLRKRAQTSTLQAPAIDVEESPDTTTGEPETRVEEAEEVAETPSVAPPVAPPEEDAPSVEDQEAEEQVDPAPSSSETSSSEPSTELASPTSPEPAVPDLDPADRPTTELESAGLASAEAETGPETSDDSPGLIEEPASTSSDASAQVSVAPPSDSPSASDSLATMRWDQDQLQEQLKAEREKLEAEKAAADSAPAAVSPPQEEDEPRQAEAEPAEEATQEPVEAADPGDETHPGVAATAVEAPQEATPSSPAVGAPAAPEPASPEPASPEPASPEPAKAPSPDQGKAQVAPPEDIDGPGRAFAGSPADNSEVEAKKERARRLARLLVSEIKLYNEEQVEAGRSQGNIYAALKEDIDRSRQMYEERVDVQVRESTDFFHEELVRMLAAGDPSVLGI